MIQRPNNHQYINAASAALWPVQSPLVRSPVERAFSFIEKAMAWIKMRTDLARDPAVIQLADRYGWEEHVIVGLLHKLWSWADEQVEDGNASGVTKTWIDRYIGVTGFSENLENVGWLSENSEGIAFPNWERHMGQSAKTRAVTALRVGKYRNAPTVTKTLPDKIREEKRREELKESKPKKEKPVVDLSSFQENLQNSVASWLAYKAERHESYKPQGLKALLTQLTKAESQHGSAAVADAIQSAMSNGWKGWQPRGWSTNGRQQKTFDELKLERTAEAVRDFGNE